MNNIKIMFHSPRFVIGFILFFTVVLYAVFFPVFNPADPKADRRENPLYSQTLTLKNALEQNDDTAVQSEVARLQGSSSEELKEIVTNVQAALDGGGLSKALSGVKQVKKRNPLYAEFANLRTYLGAEEGTTADEAAARTELDSLEAHHKAVEGICQMADAGDTAGAQAAIEANGLTEEFAALSELLNAQTPDTQAITAATAEIMENHEGTYKWVQEIRTRLDGTGYEDALTVLSDIQKTTLIPKDQAPDSEFLLGTDNFSRDVLLEMAYGARLSLEVGLMAGVIATVLGLMIGLVAGFLGGWLDNILTTVTNTFIVIPSMIVLILISVALGQIKDAWVTGLVIGLTAWPWTARAVRAQTTSLRYRDHVNMARITGYSTAHIICTEILPYIASYVVMAFILQVASGIMSEATLAILGLGDPTGISLGRMINWAMQYEAVRSGRWWQFVPVACAIAMISFGLYMMNSGMDQVFNPKIRS